jgi:Protein of unknown function (DUF1553)/Protein of unknown function (DUF1549)/Planctomycete cytochrome C
VLCAWGGVAAGAEDGLDFFEKEIRPLLAQHCYECHSAESKKLKGGLRLDSREAVLRGGDSGPAAVVGAPESSRLVAAISGRDKDLEMPPNKPLHPAQIGALSEWVRRGLPSPKESAVTSKPGYGMTLEEGQSFWSYKPVKQPVLPEVRHPQWVEQALDAFIVSRLEAAGITPSPKADKRTLLRRVCFDLTGLPPTMEQTKAFLEDGAPDAFERVVEQLLASSAYGERWGRHWLDVVRYADTCGNASDYPVPQAVLYRNWVINAVNNDMPYDRFLQEQIAGDLLPEEGEEARYERIIATGYLAMARRFAGKAGEPHLTIDDTIDNLSRAILGSSIACARCHNHKFDPFTMEDYYGLYGFFSSSRYPYPGAEGDPKQNQFVSLLAPEERRRITAPHQEETAAAQSALKQIESEQEQLNSEVDTPEKTARAAKIKERVEAAKKKLSDLAPRAPVLREAYAVAESEKPADAKIQLRGDPKNLGPAVRRKFPAILGGMLLPEATPGSGRLELAKWLSAASNPLTARVLVNRVWLQHFGAGLVTTPNDFGRQGQAPSHPELLDYLANRFVQEGWSLKKLHRTIVLSRTWQLSSMTTAELLEMDPSNALLSHANRRRLDAESFRDALLFVSAQLEPPPSGEHPFPARHTWKWTQHSPFSEAYENQSRSVYLMQSRLRKNAYLTLFDGPDPSSSTGMRQRTTTALQSLFGMNSTLMHRCGEALAEHHLGGVSEDHTKIQAAYEHTLGRAPSPVEMADALAFLEAYEKALAPQPPGTGRKAVWAALARSLLSSNEFLYID